MASTTSMPPIPADTPSWLSATFKNFSLDTCGQLALANLKSVARRTALTGSSCYLDALVLCPGFQTQQDAGDLNRGEYPACANMTSDYVFRIENQATVLFLQKVGRPGHLTTLAVRSLDDASRPWANLLRPCFDLHGFPSVPSCAILLAASSTVAIFSTVTAIEDWWALAAIATLVFARLLNVIVIQRRAKPGWFGASEPGVVGDLLVLLSQDRWIRIKGSTDDLKRVTSGQWLADPTFVGTTMVGLGTLLAYLDIVLVSNASQLGKVLIIALLVGSAGLLGLANECTQSLQMHGRIIEVESEPVKYHRRRDLADELIKETKRDGWAVRLGMIHPKKSDSGLEGPPIM